MYDHYVAIDWAQRNMAISRMTNQSDQITAVDVPSSVKELQVYLERLRGKKLITFEETDTSQWLYTELKTYVDQIIVCDPYRNKLLSEGPKTDKIDSKKLVQLLRAGLLKPVFHTGDEFIYLRKIVSGYLDVVGAGVRFKNQRAALFRAQGKRKTEKELDDAVDRFVLEGIDRGIQTYGQEKARYEKEFRRLAHRHSMIRNLATLPGIGLIGAVKVAAIVVDPKRFKNKGHFLSYSGLVRLTKMSGGRSYGQREPRSNRVLKSVFKTAALSTIVMANEQNPLRQYYEYLLKEKRYAEHNARHAVARRVAVLAWGVLKTKKKFNWRSKAKLNT